ncbi:MAG: hypothetical protein U5K38_16100 [Woeseiaceae bacterium]|nr:hypothetical protein [Woeseiaceae bacterium]
MNLVYSAAYLDRDADSVSDYTHYAQYLDNYYALYGGCYHTDGTTLTCTNPAQFISGDETFTRQSHEIRLQSSGENRLRWTAGHVACPAPGARFRPAPGTCRTWTPTSTRRV